jgi:hypothetical protein
LTAYFDVADVVESARDSGLWSIDGTTKACTGDGIHETANCYMRIRNSGAVNASLIQ